MIIHGVLFPQALDIGTSISWLRPDLLSQRVSRTDRRRNLHTTGV
jgi:hypothetical protein